MKCEPHLDTLINDYPRLADCRDDIYAAYGIMRDSFSAGGKLLLCGNGGSACDCEHIAGELMKGFLLKRSLTEPVCASLAAAGEEGALLADKLQRALPTIVLNGLPGLSSAFQNDVHGELTYAQQALAYAKPGDVLLGITTSGNARNVRLAAIAARASGAHIIGLTGEGGGQLAPLCDVCIRVPEHETYRVQELHLPVYHALCAMLEANFFGAGERE